jgi:hypothetical protein
MNQHFKLLGYKVRDVVSGFEGVAESISFDLYGCIQIAVHPEMDKKTKPGEFPSGRWFDAKRLTVISKAPVMAVPNFNQPEIGAADKPARSSLPAR